MILKKKSITSLKLSLKSKKIDFKKLSRAFYKIALCTVAYDKGKKYALGNKFDHIRDFVLNNKPINNNLLMLKNCVPTPSGTITVYYDSPQDVPVVINIFGVVFIVHLNENPFINSKTTDIETQFLVQDLSK